MRRKYYVWNFNTFVPAEIAFLSPDLQNINQIEMHFMNRNWSFFNRQLLFIVSPSFLSSRMMDFDIQIRMRGDFGKSKQIHKKKTAINSQMQILIIWLILFFSFHPQKKIYCRLKIHRWRKEGRKKFKI